MRWRAIVFDLDDTLYSEHAYVMSGFRAVSVWAADILGISPNESFETLLKLFHNGVRGNTFNQWLAGYAICDDKLVQAALVVYRTHHPTDLQPFPGVEQLLADLRCHVKIGLVSDGYLDVQRRKLQSLGLASYFDAVVFSDELGRENWKPSTLPFKVVCQRLGVDPTLAVYVGDNPIKDFLGPRQLGMSTVQVNDGKGEYSARLPVTSEHAADVILPSVLEIPQLLAKQCEQSCPRHAL